MKVLAADGISPKGIELLQKEFEVVVKDKLPAEELLEIIPDFDALIVRSASKVTAEVIARAKKLKIIGRAGVGVDNIDIPAATAKGIIVINSPGGNTIAATEHTMAMMLAMSRNIPIANETMHKGEWNRKKYVGVELRGKTLGVVGMGRIGSGVAKRAMAFDMNVLAYDPYINEERAKRSASRSRRSRGHRELRLHHGAHAADEGDEGHDRDGADEEDEAGRPPRQLRARRHHR